MDLLSNESTLTTEALLTRIVNVAQTHDAPGASGLAFQMACILFNSGLYTQAAECLEGAVAVPANIEMLWPTLRQALINACHTLASKRADAPTVRASNEANHHAPQPIITASNPTAPPVLAVTNLGAFSVARAGQLLPICRVRKAINLFRYLLTRPSLSASKEELMSLHWPHVRPQAASHSLHVAISALRHYLDTSTHSYIRFDMGTYAIVHAGLINNDCAVFQGNIRIADQAWRSGSREDAGQAYAAAIAVYGGDYYIDDYDIDWALAERERLLAKYITALDRLSQINMERQEFSEAIVCCCRLLERDNYREDIHCRLMRCYRALGRRSEALQQYERCASVLKTELGLDPMPGTVTLFHEIRHGTIERSA